MELDEHATRNAGSIIIAPAHLLLKPPSEIAIGDYHATNEIMSMPRHVRKRILEMDPFLRNLDGFFGNTIDDLADVAYQYANPPDLMNRAASLSSYIMGCGTELDLSQVGAIDLGDCSSVEKEFLADATVAPNFDPLDYASSFFRLQNRRTDKRTLRVVYRASVEAEQGSIKTARCILVHNQGCGDIRRMRLWWDKIFSTFMFQFPQEIELEAHVVGVVSDSNGIGIGDLEVILAGEGFSRKTATDPDGNYDVPVEKPGKYEVRCEGKSKKVRLGKNDIKYKKCFIANFENMKRKLNLGTLAARQLMMLLQIPLDRALRIRVQLAEAKKIDERTFGAILKREGISLAELKKVADIQYPQSKPVGRPKDAKRTKS